MGFLLERCTLKVYNEDIHRICFPFDCGDNDLNDFFANDVIKYSNELLGKSYCFTLDEDDRQIVAAFTISNDSIKTFSLPNARKKKIIAEIPREKHMKSYPAVLIGRLGVNNLIRKKIKEENTIGDQLMDFIKSWFIDKGNKTGCRFIIVDAYNKITTLNYYKRNGFIELFSSEEQEKKYINVSEEKTLSTRLLYYDLILITE